MKQMATGSKAPEALLSHDWLGACRRAAEGLRAVLREHPTSTQRVVETGERGGGGDLTLVIDAAAEDAVFSELDRLHAAGARFTSVAVADGATMADVAFGYVYDLGPGEEWRATRGGGAFLNDVPLDHPQPERRRKDGKLELVAIESANPKWLAASSDALLRVTGRVRAMGSIAISLCQVAATRVDGMATLANCRAVDAAAGQLIVRESGGVVAFTACDEPLSAPLDLEPRSPVVAARTEAALAELATVPASDL